MTWYRDADELRRRLEEHNYNASVLADVTGVSRHTLSAWRRRLGIEFPQSIGDPRAGVRRLDNAIEKQRSGASPDAVAVRQVLAKARTELDIHELCDRVDMSPKRVRAALDQLAELGFNVEVGESSARLETTATRGTGEPSASRIRLTTGLFKGDRVRIGSVSDTHLGSNHEALEELHAAYDLFEEQGIKDVIHGGDLTDGIGVYGAKHRLHIHKHTYEEQVEHAAREYPHRKGIRTRLIAGNHDIEGDFGRAGANPVRAVCNQRDDMEYIGDYSAWVELPNGATIHVLHPMGGGSYAKSYKPQKIVEGYDGGTKPNMLWYGHWHQMLFLWVRNVAVVGLASFKRTNELAVRAALGEAIVGCWIHDMTLADDGSVVRYRPEWYPFYKGRVA